MAAAGYETERLDHLGIVAGVCREIGLAAYLDALDEREHERVSVGTATVAMLLNGLGFSNRRLYLVPQFFATKPVGHLLGAGVTAEDLNDDCLGRALDWLYAHDPTALFAGIAARARRAFGVAAHQLHADTTTFSVHGAYADAGPEAEGGELDARAIAITYGYSRDHRDDLKQWALGLVTTHEGDVPVGFQALDGNASDQASLPEMVAGVLAQLRAAGDEPPGLVVADSALYSQATVARLNAAGVRWVSRVPETSTPAKAAVAEVAGAAEADWCADEAAGAARWIERRLTLPQGEERWLVVRTPAGEERARATLGRRAQEERADAERRLWHLGHRAFACQADAAAEARRQVEGLPPWLVAEAGVVARAHYAGRGRPARDAVPTRHTWHVQATVRLDPDRLELEVRRRACFLVATNVLDAAELPAAEAIRIYTRDQGGVERGFAFLKDPLFLASSVFLKKPERIVALSLVMVLCLLVYRLAEHRLRQRLAATGRTVPDQRDRPTARPTLRWIFQCFEGLDRLTIPTPAGPQVLVLHLGPLHEQVLTLLGPPYRELYHLTN